MMRLAIVAVILFMAGLVLRAADTMPTATIPRDSEAKARVNTSPRHPEFDEVPVPGAKPIKCFVVYPERKDKAPVVVVIMDIYGLGDWAQGICDQLAADGFIAIAPDFLTGKGPNGGGSESFTNRNDTVRAVGGLKPAEVMADVAAARAYGLKMPSCNGKSASMGFCWGGGMSFLYATQEPELNAATVFYGTPPADDALAKIKCPVAGFYGGNDNRVTSTVASTTTKMKTLSKSYDPHVFDGAGHGFMRGMTPERDGDLKAAQQAWPLAIKFLTDNTK